MSGVVVTEEQVRDEILIGTWRIGVSQCLALGHYGYGLACTAQRGLVLRIKFAVVSCPIEIASRVVFSENEARSLIVAGATGNERSYVPARES